MINPGDFQNSHSKISEFDSFEPLFPKEIESSQQQINEAKVELLGQIDEFVVGRPDATATLKAEKYLRNVEYLREYEQLESVEKYFQKKCEDFKLQIEAARSSLREAMGEDDDESDEECNSDFTCLNHF